MDLNQDLALIDVLIVVEMEEYDLIKVFLQFNKHVHNVLVSGEEITNPCTDCNGQGNKQTSKKISVTFQKVLMMEQELDLLEKVKLVQRWSYVEIYIYL